MNRRQLKARAFINFADSIADFATCKRRKVGCIIFDTAFQHVYSIGYNGPPVGADHAQCTGLPPKCGCLHAEVNALLKLKTTDTTNLVLYSTLMPCITCAGYIINRGIGLVVCRDETENRDGWKRLSFCFSTRAMMLADYYDSLS